MRIKLMSIFLMLSISANAQNIGLNIGDQLPKFQIQKIINGVKESASTSDYSEKLLIIDFWSRGCLTCIEIMPEMKALQQKFGNQIKILPVTFEKAEAIIPFLKQNPYTKSLNVETVVEDTLFQSYFKHVSLPHEAWIYKGKVIGITGHEFVDSLNIHKVLSGEEVNWPVKNDFYNFNRKMPIFDVKAREAEGFSMPRSYVGIGDYRERVSSEGMTGGQGVVRDSLSNTIRSFHLNRPILDIYLSQFFIIQKNIASKLTRPDVYFNATEMANQIVWEVADRSKYTWEKKFGYSQEWLRKNAICYESSEPDRGQTEVELAGANLKRLDVMLGLNVRWEKRREKVLVLLKANSVKETPKSALGQIKVSSSSIAAYFNTESLNPYMFDQTKEANPILLYVDIKSWTDIEGLRKSLGPYGYEIKEEIREVDKLIFTENGYNPNRK